MAFVIAVDIGGTFTDLVAYDFATGEVRYAKSPTTYGDFVAGIVPGADDIGNMFQFKAGNRRAPTAGLGTLSLAGLLNPELQTFARWLSRNKSRIPAPRVETERHRKQRHLLRIPDGTRRQDLHESEELECRSHALGHPPSG